MRTVIETKGLGITIEQINKHKKIAKNRESLQLMLSNIVDFCIEDYMKNGYQPMYEASKKVLEIMVMLEDEKSE